MNPRTVTAAARLALVAAVAGVTWLATTDRALPELASLSDKVNHGLAFLVLALLADRSFPQARLGLPMIAALVAYGAAIEAVQYFLPYREASLADLVADAAGVALYAAVRPLLLTIPVFRAPPNR